MHHTESLPHISKFVDVVIPNVKSSMGAQAASEPGNRGILESLKLLGAQMSSLVSWLIDRVNGEKMTQEIISTVLETAQNTIDDELRRVRRERIEVEKARKAAAEKQRLEKEKAEAEEQERLRKQHIELEKASGSGGAVVV